MPKQRPPNRLPKPAQKTKTLTHRLPRAKTSQQTRMVTPKQHLPPKRLPKTVPKAKIPTRPAITQTATTKSATKTAHTNQQGAATPLFLLEQTDFLANPPLSFRETG